MLSNGGVELMLHSECLFMFPYLCMNVPLVMSFTAFGM